MSAVAFVRRYYNDTLYRNSFVLVICRVFNAAIVGFLFWTVAAHNYAVAAVGIGTALISATDLLMYLSAMGFDMSIVRYTPIRDPNKVFSIALWVTIIASVILGVAFLGVVGLIVPEISIVKGIWPFFLLIVTVSAIMNILGRTFIAHRKPKFLFLQYLIMAIRLPLLIPLMFLGGLGIYFAAGISHVLVAIISFFIVLSFIKITFNIDRCMVRDMFRFSAFNYVSNIFTMTPELTLPLIVISILGPEAAALYYIAFAIGSLIMSIPDAVGTSFFVEGSHGNGEPRNQALKSLVFSVIVLIPIVAGAILFGKHILQFFGPAYIAAYPLLVVFALSSVLVAIHKICIPFLNIHMRAKMVMIVNGLRMVLLFGLVPIGLTMFGILGAGYAWILAYGIIAVPLLWALIRTNNRNNDILTGRNDLS